MTMTIPELAELAQRTRSRREAGFALVLASAILALFLFVPLGHGEDAKAPVVVATTTTPLFAVGPIEAQAAIVYDLATGETLYAKNADDQLPLASLTKLLTVYAALANLPAATPITVSPEAALAEAPNAFEAGETFTLGDLAQITLTASLNDGAMAIAEAVAEAEQRSTSEALAGAAAALHLADTYAYNGSGLDVNIAVSGGYGSARDIARLAGALAATAPAIALATTESEARATSFDGTTYRVKNTDSIVGAIPRLLLSKTGFTTLAGGNLALVFDAAVGHPISIVVLGSSDKDTRFIDGMTLVAATLAHFAGLSPW